ATRTIGSWSYFVSTTATLLICFLPLRCPMVANVLRPVQDFPVLRRLVCCESEIAPARWAKATVGRITDERPPALSPRGRCPPALHCATVRPNRGPMTGPHGGHLADQSPGGRRQVNRPPRPKAARYAAGPHADLGLEDQDALNETSHRSAQDAWQRSEHKQRPSGRNAPQSPTGPELSQGAGTRRKQARSVSPGEHQNGERDDHGRRSIDEVTVARVAV